MSIEFEKRVQVNRIIESQLPEFVVADFPLATELLKTYYISQENQGANADLLDNLDRYIKVDNLVPEVITGTTTLTKEVVITETEILVNSTKGFPSSYGLLKIDNEIITYTGKTDTSFTGCIRGFSGVTGHHVGISSSLDHVNSEHLVFEDTNASGHANESTVTNLSVLFLQEFYKKIKRTFLPGLEDNKFADGIDVGNFIKNARSFYQSKGIAESIRILFKVLYGVEAEVIDLEERLVKPSSAEYIRREIIIADALNGEAQNLVGQTIFKSTDLRTNASVSEVEVLTRDNKLYYKLSLFVGFNDKDLIEGTFTIPGKTKVLEQVVPGESIVSVDSTIGFGQTGNFTVDYLDGNVGIITYTSKTVNQFFGCSDITGNIGIASDLRSTETIFGYENGDLSKRVDLRITGVVSDFVPESDIALISERQEITVKNVGEFIQNPSETTQSYKQIFANSWIYNTSSRYEINGSINSGTTSFTFLSKIDKSSLKVGDSFDIIRRGTNIRVGGGIVKRIDSDYVFTGEGVNYIANEPHSSVFYDIRRNLRKANYDTGNPNAIKLSDGTNKIIADTLNVYVDRDDFGYAASNSLSSHKINQEPLNGTIPSGAPPNIQTGTINALTGVEIDFTEIKFAEKVKFRTGDSIIYTSDKPLLGLNNGSKYFVKSDSTEKVIRLYDTINAIERDAAKEFNQPSDPNATHTFTLEDHYNKEIISNNILRKFSLGQDLNIPSKEQKQSKNIGLLINGVQLRSNTNDDFITYGPIEKTEVYNSGEGYDVVNPPKIRVGNANTFIKPNGTVGIGTTALVEPVIRGNVKEILVDPQDFDIDNVSSVRLTGGNGKDCFLQPVVGPRYREVEFDSRDIFFSGGLDVQEETITFKSEHNFVDGQLIYYNKNGQDAIGITPFKSAATTVTEYLVNGAPYYVKVLNPKRIRLFKRPEEATFGVAGINTIGFSTATTAAGIHKFRTEAKNTLNSVKVINPGYDYQYRKLPVSPSGISTSYDTINFVNHGFRDGDIVEYSTDGTTIEGLDTSLSYLVIKIDANSFRLAKSDAVGVARTDFERGKYVDLRSTGTGYQIFKYPDIKIETTVSFATTVTGSYEGKITPIIEGEIIDAYTYDNGSNYGSSIINHIIKPDVEIINGKGAEIKAFIDAGKILDIIVLNGGQEYNSLPHIKIEGPTGNGAILRPIISNGKLDDIVVINPGIGYSSTDTNVYVDPRGKNGLLSPQIRRLEIDDIQKRGMNIHLEPSGDDGLIYEVKAYDQSLRDEFGDSGINNAGIGTHSPLIGWAYDGNPIYGAFGYSVPNDIGEVKRLKSGYVKDNTWYDRPEQDSGYFLDDYKFDGSGDLDKYNGRFCKTPEFPNGVYAYFATLDENENPQYPYFIGKTYRSPFISDNLSLNQKFDFNNSTLSRNTLPYKVNDRYANNDFIIESNEIIKQKSVIESVTRGVVDTFQVLDGGKNYKVGDFTSFDNEGTGGSGARGQVDRIVGIGVSNIKTELTTFENATLIWKDAQTVEAHFLPKIELNDQDTVLISGLSTANYKLNNSFKVGISTDIIGLAKTMTVNNNPNGKTEDIYVNIIPNTVSVGGSLRVGDETLKVLNLYGLEKIIRVQRYGTGIGHTYSSEIDVLNNRISIPVKSNYFDSKLNDLVHFNGHQSVGLGTTCGSVIDYEYGEITNTTNVPQQSIYLPGHPFSNGQKIKLSKPLTATSFLVSRDDDASNQFYIPDQSTAISELYVVDKGTDYIGLATNVGAASTESGLFFFGNGDNNYQYLIESDHDQLTANIDRVVSTVTTKVALANTTTHGLAVGDLIDLDVVPNIAVGIGSTAPLTVSFNDEHQKLLINEVSFNATAVVLNTDTITIPDHGYKTGTKVFYDNQEIISGSSLVGGLSVGAYYVHTIDSNTINLCETYKDSIVTPPRIVDLTGQGNNKHTLSLINPPITVVKNSDLTFGVGSTSLENYKLKFFYDREFKNEFVNATSYDPLESVQASFSVVGVGTVGVGTFSSSPVVGAAVSIGFSTACPSVLYYALEHNGYISTADTGVYDYSEIRFVDSAYSGEFRVFDVDDETFKISPRSVPEVLEYHDNQCDLFEYSSKSGNIVGPIKSIKTISEGFSYKSIPGFTSITSADGENANVVALSTSIGRINNLRIIDYGFEYSADKTLRPEAYISPIVRVDDLDVIESIKVINPGAEYLSAPDVILFNPESKKVVDTTSLLATVPNQGISEINVIAPIKGLDSVNHRVITINNSNGIGIVSMTTEGTVARCVMETPINGYDVPPFAPGDEIFVEGILMGWESGIGTQTSSTAGISTEGTGYNSEDYDYQFLKVKSYDSSNPDVLKFDLVGLTTNPGIAKTYQTGYANIVNRKNYPVFETDQKRAEFTISENLLVSQGNPFVKSDLTVTETRDDYIKVDGLDNLRIGDRIAGESSGTSATVVGIDNQYAKFNVDYSNRQDYGWTDNTGKLSEDFQVTPNNDYFQNLSYSIKSEKTWDDIVDPVNRLVHPAGLKNFADTVVETTLVGVGIGSTFFTTPTLVLDVVGERRVDTINDFDLGIDFEPRESGNTRDSKFVDFQNAKLTDYSKCKTNRVLIHDDISGRFSSKGIQDLFTEIEELNTNYARYLVQIVDADTFDIQISDLIVLTSTENAYLIEKSLDYSNMKLGDFSADVDYFKRKTLLFTPTDKFDKDHDIKLLKTSFNTDNITDGTKEFGSVDLIGNNVSVSAGRTMFSATISGTTLTTTDFDLLGLKHVNGLPTTDSLVGIGTTVSGLGLIKDTLGNELTEIVSIDSSSTATIKINPDTTPNAPTVPSTYTTPVTGQFGFINTPYFVNNGVGGLDPVAVPIGVSTSNIMEFADTNCNAFYASVVAKDDVTGELDYTEAIVNVNGSDVSISQLYADLTQTSLSIIDNGTVGILTASYDSGTIKFDCINERRSTIRLSTSVVGLGTTSAGIGTYRFNVPGQPQGAERTARYESTYNTTEVGTGVTVASIDRTIDSTVKSIIKVRQGDKFAIHQPILIHDQNNDAITVQYPHIGEVSGLGTFGSETDTQNVNLVFYPDDTGLVEVQSYNEVFNTINDFANEPDVLQYGPVTSDLLLTSYDGVNGTRGNKVNFNLTYQGIPIYVKKFNPTDTTRVITDSTPGAGTTFAIPNHFFNTNEELTYTPESTFIGVPPVSVGIAATLDADGSLVTVMPSKVFVKAGSADKFQIYSRKEYIDVGNPITITTNGSGNAHKFEMTKKLSKTVIGLDGIVQQPVTYTAIKHSLPSNIGIGISQFALSGISSVQPRDVLKINNEYMKVEQVGFATEVDATINSSEDWASIPVVRVKRGALGIDASTHSAGDEVRIHRGSFNIVDSTAWFLDPPKGNTRSRRNDTNIPYVRAEYSGRTFLRTNYDTNMVFDDISDSFTGIGKTYTLTVGGANTVSGVGVGNGILFINGVFQTPLTLNNLGNNYEIEGNATAGVSSVTFTGISSENGQKIESEFDINQNQLPRGGLIVSMGSTTGLGYAPLVGARVLAKETNGVLDSIVSIASSVGPIGSGIETAHYDPVTGIMTVTTNTVHGFALESPETVKLEDLHFTCPTYTIGQPITGTTYNPATGDMVIKIAGHGLSNGDSVKLKEESITFSCGFGGATGSAAEKSYPRKTDPAYDRYMYISDVTTDTFKVNVLFGVTPTNTDAHTFVSATTDCVQSLNYIGVTTSIFQNHERPIPLVGVTSERSFQVNVGITSIHHNYLKGGGVYAFYDELTPGSGYREPVSIGVTDINYLHKFVSATTDAITAYTGSFMGQNLNPTLADYNSETGSLLFTTEVHGIPEPVDLDINDAKYDARVGILTAYAGTNFDVSGATYDPTTGNMVLEIGDHDVDTNDKVKIAPNSITFSCTFDNQVGIDSHKSYPRSSGTGNAGGGADPAYDTYLNVIATDKLAGTITVKVLTTTPSTNTDPHLFVSATDGCVFVPRVFTNNEQVKFVDGAITFKCDMDGNTTEHPYPRLSDPARDKWLLVSQANNNKFEVQVGMSPLVGWTPQLTGTSYDPNTGLMVLEIGAHTLKAGERVRLDPLSLKFSCGFGGATGSAAEKSYPRSTDPYYNTAIPIQSVTETSITLQVLTSVPSTNTDPHTFVSATTGAVKSGGFYPHTYVSSIAKGVRATKSMKIATNSLTFKCSKDNFIGNHTYPRATDPAYDTFLPITGASQNTLLTNIGPGGGAGTGAVVTAMVAPNRHKFVNAIGTHKYVDSISDAVTVAGVKRDVSNAVYTPSTGDFTLTIGNHSFTTSDTVTIAPKAIIMTCDADSHGSNHAYPRPTDPAYNTPLAITAVTAQKITCNVGKPAQIESVTADVGGPFTANTAAYDPQSGIMTVTTANAHGFTASDTLSTNTAIYDPRAGVCTITTTINHGLSNGDWVKLEDNSIFFECSEDNYASEHSYPRSTDPLSNKWVQITIDGADKIEIQALSTLPSTNISAHQYLRSVENNIQKANNRVKFATGSLVFQCNKDQYSTNHAYPRTTDPYYDTFMGVETIVSTKKFTVNVGKSPAGTGGALEFTIVDGGSGYVNPELMIPQPVYEDMPIVGVSRLGVGKTTDTGENLLLNIKVGSASTAVGIGSTLFEISDFAISRPGHSFKVGDRFKPIGLVTSSELREPLKEFELEVVEIFNDFFAAWQFGEIDFIDNIENLQNGVRRRFPLFFNGQLLSFETDENDSISSDIDLNAVLLIFVNGVIQTPGIAYQFEGGATFTFTEAPDTGDKVDIFFYLGQRGIDVEIIDIQETIKPGDDIRLLRYVPGRLDQNRNRTVKEILSSDILETDIYTGPGIDSLDDFIWRPVDWEKQKVDKIIEGSLVSKDRESIEPCVYPTAKVISDVKIDSGIGLDLQDGIFVDDAEIFFYEEGPLRLPSSERYGVTVDAVDTILMPAAPDQTPADVTLVLGNNVGTGNTEVTSYTIANNGKGYLTTPTVRISNPPEIGVGIGSTATATATISNGSLTALTITSSGYGYKVAPQVIIENPLYKTEDVNLIKYGQGFTGIITGIGTAVGTGGHPLALEFFFNVTDGKQASLLQAGYPILVKETSIGDGVTSVDSHDTSIVGIGTTFLDNIYKVHSITVAGDKVAKIKCNVLSTTNHVGLASTGRYLTGNVGVTTCLGKITWGRLYGDTTTREASPISIGVTGLTIDSGLSTFPTIQRRNNVLGSLKGLRNTGAIRLQVL